MKYIREDGEFKCKKCKQICHDDDESMNKESVCMDCAGD